MSIQEWAFGYDPGTPEGDKSRVVVWENDTMVGVFVPEEELSTAREKAVKEERERIAALCYQNLTPEEMYYRIFNPDENTTN